MRGAHVQKQELAAIRQGWRNGCYTAPPAELSGLSEPYALRKGTHTPNAPALGASQSRRLWRSPGREGNTMLSNSSPTHLSGAASRRFHREGGRKPVLFPHAVENSNLALDVDALLAESSPNKRLGNHPKELSLPVHIWYLWRSTGIKSGTCGNWKQATGIKSGTSGGVFRIPQVPNMDHSY